MRPAGQSSHCRRADEKRHTALSVRPRSRPPTTYTKCAGSEDSGEAAVGGPVLVLLAAGVLVLEVLLLVLLLVLVLGVGWATRTWRKSWLRDGKEAPHCRHASAAEEEEEEEEEEEGEGSVSAMAMSVRDRGREGGWVSE